MVTRIQSLFLMYCTFPVYYKHPHSLTNHLNINHISLSTSPAVFCVVCITNCLTIDDQLSWQPHVSSAVQKASVAIRQLWRHGRSLPIRARRLWYIGIVQARLTYASNAFFPSLTQQLQSRLIRSSKSGIRAILRLSSHASTAPHLVSLSIRSLTHIFHYKVLFFCFPLPA